MQKYNLYKQVLEQFYLLDKALITVALFFFFFCYAEGNMLNAFLPLLVKVCSSPGKYSHPQLTTAACLALSQYMMIRYFFYNILHYS